MAGAQSLWDSFLNLVQPGPQVRAPAGLPDYGRPYVPLDSKLNFEQRVLYPSRYPTLPQPNGGIATHKMAWDGGDGNYMAYPTVVQKPDGKLYELGPDQAYDYATKSGEFRHFTDAKEAEAYAAGGYKQQWGAGEPKRSLVESLFNLGR